MEGVVASVAENEDFLVLAGVANLAVLLDVILGRNIGYLHDLDVLMAVMLQFLKCLQLLEIGRQNQLPQFLHLLRPSPL